MISIIISIVILIVLFVIISAVAVDKYDRIMKIKNMFEEGQTKTIERQQKVIEMYQSKIEYQNNKIIRMVKYGYNDMEKDYFKNDVCNEIVGIIQIVNHFLYQYEKAKNYITSESIRKVCIEFLEDLKIIMIKEIENRCNCDDCKVTIEEMKKIFNEEIKKY